MFQTVNMADFSAYTRKVPFEDYPEMALMTLGVRSYLVNGIAHSYTTDAHVLIGNYCSIAHMEHFFLGMNHDHYAITSYPLASVLDSSDDNKHAAYNRHQITIGTDVWIGGGSMIMSGVHIGNGAVIGAGSVIAKDVPPYAIVVGNPARVIKYRFDAETITRLQRIKWWYWMQEEIERYIPEFNHDMAAFLDRFDPGVREETPDDTTAQIHQLRADGYDVSYFIPDFEIDPMYAVWPRVIDRFLTAYTAADRAALMLALPEGEDTDAYASAIASRMAEHGDRAPLILSHSCPRKMPFSISALKASSTYITTREPVCSYAVDYAADADLTIRYGLDRGTLLFPQI